MIKTIVLVVVIVALLVLLGSGIHLYRVAQKNAYEMAKFENMEIKAEPKTGKTLVVYYSLTGHTKEIAEKIAEYTKADIFEIKTVENFKADVFFYVNIRKQLKSGKYPELAGNMPDFAKYDTIFVGGPVWWYAPATPLLAFLKKADFKTKKVVPFSTQGSNYGSFLVDFKQMVYNAKLRQSESFNNLPKKYDRAVNNKIISWINSIN